MAWEEMSEEEINSQKEFESEFWNPEKGDVLEGDVVLIKKGQYGKLFMIIIDDDDNSWITTQCANLDKQIRGLKIEEGDTVHLTYNGRRDDEYQSHDYKLLKWVED